MAASPRRNYRTWHPGTGIGLPNDILSFLKEENELVVEPAGPADFFKLRNLQMSITLADGRTIRAEPVHAAYSSCAGPLAEGVIGSPMRITIRFPRWKELVGVAPAAAAPAGRIRGTRTDIDSLGKIQ